MTGRLLAIALLFCVLVSGQTRTVAVSQQAGNCAPNVANVQGNVVVNIQPGSCPGIDLPLLQRLVGQAIKMAAPDAASQKRTIDNLNKFLDVKDRDIAAKLRVIEDQQKTIQGLTARLESERTSPDKEVVAQALVAIREARYEDAAKLYDGLL